MNRTQHRVRIATAIFGVFTAIVIVFFHLFYFQAARYYHKKEAKAAKTEKHDSHKPGESKVYFSTPSSSVLPTSAHPQSNPESVFIFEILFEDKNEEPSFTTPVPSGTLFQTLFRVIISPNAP